MFLSFQSVKCSQDTNPNKAFFMTISIVCNPKVSIIRLESTSVFTRIKVGSSSTGDYLFTDSVRCKNEICLTTPITCLQGCRDGTCGPCFRCTVVVLLLMMQGRVHGIAKAAVQPYLIVPGTGNHTSVCRLLGLGDVGRR